MIINVQNIIPQRHNEGVKKEEIEVRTLKLVCLSAATAITMMAFPALAEDIVKGEKLAKKCKACHTLNEGGKNRLGPNLYNILGSPAGAVEGYKYSKAMKASGLTWDDTTFTEFMTKPKKFLKGTKMSFKGFKKADQREDLLAYFKTLQSEGREQAAVGNIEEGIKVAAKHCTVCHTFEKGGKVLFGPNLFNITGKPAGAIEGFTYSKALKASGITWSDKNLVGFLADPEGFLKGTTARFPGLKSAKDKSDILAYLKSLK